MHINANLTEDDQFRIFPDQDWENPFLVIDYNTELLNKIPLNDEEKIKLSKSLFNNFIELLQTKTNSHEKNI
jgi:hypothetical protein